MRRWAVLQATLNLLPREKGEPRVGSTVPSCVRACLSHVGRDARVRGTVVQRQNHTTTLAHSTLSQAERSTCCQRLGYEARLPPSWSCSLAPIQSTVEWPRPRTSDLETSHWPGPTPSRLVHTWGGSRGQLLDQEVGWETQQARESWTTRRAVVNPERQPARCSVLSPSLGARTQADWRGPSHVVREVTPLSY